MGSNCCSGEQDKKAEAAAMTKRSEEIKSNLIDEPKQSNNDDAYKSSYDIINNKKKLQHYLHQLGEGAIKVHEFYKKLKGKDYQNYQQLCLFLTRSQPSITINKTLHKISTEFSLLDRYTIILLETNSIQQYLSVKYNQQTVRYLLSNYLNIYSSQFDFTNLDPLVNYMLEKSKNCKTISQFVEIYKSQFICYEKTLNEYFVQKFMSQVSNCYCFRTVPKSHIMKLEHWIQLHLKTDSILKNSPSLLYSTANDGTSFTTLTYNLLGYTGPWVLALTHLEQDKLENKTQLCIIGSYQNSTVQDIAQYQGNPEGFLFRLQPTLRYFTSSNGEGDSNYFVINTINSDLKQIKRGLGFGGVEKQDCKLWIDDNIQIKSEVGGLYDPTYGSGCLALAGTTKLTIKDLQIWGLGTEQNLKARNDYQVQRQKIAIKSRTVDKREFLKGADMFFQQTFKHREQVQGEIETPAKTQNKAQEHGSGEQKHHAGSRQRSIIDDLPGPSQKSFIGNNNQDRHKSPDILIDDRDNQNTQHQQHKNKQEHKK